MLQNNICNESNSELILDLCKLAENLAINEYDLNGESAEECISFIEEKILSCINDDIEKLIFVVDRGNNSSSKMLEVETGVKKLVQKYNIYKYTMNEPESGYFTIYVNIDLDDLDGIIEEVEESELISNITGKHRSDGDCSSNKNSSSKKDSDTNEDSSNKNNSSNEDSAANEDSSNKNNSSNEDSAANKNSSNKNNSSKEDSAANKDSSNKNNSSKEDSAANKVSSISNNSSNEDSTDKNNSSISNNSHEKDSSTKDDSSICNKSSNEDSNDSKESVDNKCSSILNNSSSKDSFTSNVNFKKHSNDNISYKKSYVHNDDDDNDFSEIIEGTLSFIGDALHIMVVGPFKILGAVLSNLDFDD